jgi:hypothetical protein
VKQIKNSRGTDYLVLSPVEYINEVLGRNDERLEDIITLWVNGRFVKLDDPELQKEYNCYYIYKKYPYDKEEYFPYAWKIPEAYIWTERHCYISCEYDGHLSLEPVPLKPEYVSEEYPMYGGG